MEKDITRRDLLRYSSGLVVSSMLPKRVSPKLDFLRQEDLLNRLPRVSYFGKKLFEAAIIKIHPRDNSLFGGFSIKLGEEGLLMVYVAGLSIEEGRHGKISKSIVISPEIECVDDELRLKQFPYTQWALYGPQINLDQIIGYLPFMSISDLQNIYNNNS